MSIIKSIASKQLEVQSINGLTNLNNYNQITIDPINSTEQSSIKGQFAISHSIKIEEN